MIRGSIKFLSVPDSMVNPGRPQPLTLLEVTSVDGAISRLVLEPDDLVTLELACSARRLVMENRQDVVLDSTGASIQPHREDLP